MEATEVKTQNFDCCELEWCHYVHSENDPNGLMMRMIYHWSVSPVICQNNKTAILHEQRM